MRAHLGPGALVCIVGPPGPGRSACAHVAAPEADVVDLAWADSPLEVVAAVAWALNARVDEHGWEAGQLARIMARQPRTLLLEEPGPVVALVRSWREVAPEMTILLTRREPLGLPEEEVVEVQGTASGLLTEDLLQKAAGLSVVRARLPLDLARGLAGGGWDEVVAAGIVDIQDGGVRLRPDLRASLVEDDRLEEVRSMARGEVRSWVVVHPDPALALEVVGWRSESPESRAEVLLSVASRLADRGPVSLLVEALDTLLGIPGLTPATEARLLAERGWLSERLGEPVAARYAFEDALERAPQSALIARSRALAGLGGSKRRAGALSEAETLLRLSRELALQADDADGARLARRERAALMVSRGRSSREIGEELEASLAEARAAADPEGEVATLDSLAAALRRAGAPAERVRAALVQGIDVANGAGDVATSGRLGLSCAHVLAEQGCLAEALEVVAGARDAGERCGHLGDTAAAWALQVRLRVAVDGVVAGRATWREMVACTWSQPRVEGLVALVHGELLLREGELEESRRVLLRQLGSFLEDDGVPVLLAQARELLGVVEVLRGKPAAALARLAGALATWQRQSEPFRALRVSCMLVVAELAAGKGREAQGRTMTLRPPADSRRAQRLVELTGAILEVKTGGLGAAERWTARFRAQEHGPLEEYFLQQVLRALLA